MENFKENIIGFLDIIGFFILSYYAVRLILFNWFIQVIVCSYSLYILLKEGFLILFDKITKIKEIFRISGICFGAVKYITVFFKVLKFSSIPGILDVLKDFFFVEIKKWIKSHITQKISDLLMPFIKAKVFKFVKNKVKEFIENKIFKYMKENKKQMIYIILVISIYFISWIYWPLRQVINALITVTLLFLLYYFRSKNIDYIINYFKYNSLFLRLIPIDNKYINYIFYNIQFAQDSFTYYAYEFKENNLFYNEKSFTVQINITMICFCPILLIARYITSNILWFIGISIIGTIIYAVLFLKKEFFDKIMNWINRTIFEFILFMSSVKDISDEILEKVVKFVGRATRFIGEIVETMGVFADLFDFWRNRKKMNEDDLKNKFKSEREKFYERKNNKKEKNEKKKEEVDKDEHVDKEQNKDDEKNSKKNEEELKNTKDNEIKNEKIDENQDHNMKCEIKKKSKSSEIIDRIIQFINKNKITICFIIVVYIFFQNLLIAYICALAYSITLFIVYALYQYLIEKISKNKLNYYSVMWMFYFLNKQIIVIRIWLKFFGYQSFMYGNYKFRGFSVLQIIYFIIEFIRILISSVEIVYNIWNGISKKITSDEIISTLIFPF